MNAAVVVTLLGAMLLLDARTVRVVGAYALIVTFATLASLSSASATALTAALLAASFAMKAIVVPVGIGIFVRRNRAAADLRPALAVPARLIVVLALALLAHAVEQTRTFAGLPAIGTAAYVVLCGLALLVMHRNLLGAVIGLLVLGTGVSLAGTAVAPGIPEAVELGAAFDALVATFIGLALVRAFLAHNPLLDVTSLRKLRG